jgi:hypothetical protein
MPFGTTAKHACEPASLSRWVQAMKRSKPSTLVGGGEMNRDTSSVVSIAKSDDASSIRSSRNVMVEPASTGSACFQFVVADAAGSAIAAGLRSFCWKGIFSITAALPLSVPKRLFLTIGAGGGPSDHL